MISGSHVKWSKKEREDAESSLTPLDISKLVTFYCNKRMKNNLPASQSCQDLSWKRHSILEERARKKCKKDNNISTKKVLYFLHYSFIQ